MGKNNSDYHRISKSDL